VDEVRIAQGVEQERDEAPCFHCLNTGWVMLTAENDYGELEDYFVLCRSEACKGGATVGDRF